MKLVKISDKKAYNHLKDRIDEDFLKYFEIVYRELCGLNNEKLFVVLDNPQPFRYNSYPVCDYSLEKNLDNEIEEIIIKFIKNINPLVNCYDLNIITKIFIDNTGFDIIHVMSGKLFTNNEKFLKPILRKDKIKRVLNKIKQNGL